jgi:hypothetical protein
VLKDPQTDFTFYLYIFDITQFWSVAGLTNFSRFVMLVAFIWLWWREADSLFSYLWQFHPQSGLYFRAAFFFLGEGWYYCLVICTAIRLSSFHLLTVVVSVRLEWKSLCPRFQASPHGWSVWQLLPLLEVAWYYLFVCLICSTSGKISIGTVGTISIRWQMFTKLISTLTTRIQLHNA